MENARAVVVDSAAAGRLAIKRMPVRAPLPSQALVRVKAISLNLGEVRRALTMAQTGWRPGWGPGGGGGPAAANPSGTPAGARAFGVVGPRALGPAVGVGQQPAP